MPVLEDDDLPNLIKVARNTDDSWKRCQWLAEVALHSQDAAEAHTLIEEALAAARQQHDEYSIVHAAAWPLWVMAQRQHEGIPEVVAELLKVAQHELNVVSRGHALFYLFEAVYHQKEERKRILDELIKTCLAMKSWKRDYILAQTAAVLAFDDQAESQRVLKLIGKSQHLNRALRDIADGLVGPHRFLPYYELTKQEVKS